MGHGACKSPRSTGTSEPLGVGFTSQTDTVAQTGGQPCLARTGPVGKPDGTAKPAP